MEEGLGALIWLLFDLFLCITGRIVITAISLGHWRGERFRKGEAKIYGPAGALSFVRDGQRVITSNGLLLIGVGFYFFLVLGLVYFFSR